MVSRAGGVTLLSRIQHFSPPINFEATLPLLTIGSYHVNIGILLIDFFLNYSEALFKIMLPLPHKKIVETPSMNGHYVKVVSSVRRVFLP
jgi:hypothetical protein